MDLLARPTGALTDGSAIAVAVIAVLVGAWMTAMIFNVCGYRDGYLARMERLYRRPTGQPFRVILIAGCSMVLAFMVFLLVLSLAHVAR